MKCNDKFLLHWLNFLTSLFLGSDISSMYSFSIPMNSGFVIAFSMRRNSWVKKVLLGRVLPLLNYILSHVKVPLRVVDWLHWRTFHVGDLEESWLIDCLFSFRAESIYIKIAICGRIERHLIKKIYLSYNRLFFHLSFGETANSNPEFKLSLLIDISFWILKIKIALYLPLQEIADVFI